MAQVRATWRGILGGVAAAGVLARAGSAQGRYRDRPIRMLVDFAPGGGTDLTVRAMAPRLSQLLGQPVLVENRPDAGGNLATEAVVRATPDGHTVLMGTIAALAVKPQPLRKPALRSPQRPGGGRPRRYLA